MRYTFGRSDILQDNSGSVFILWALWDLPRKMMISRRGRRVSVGDSPVKLPKRSLAVCSVLVSRFLYRISLLCGK